MSQTSATSVQERLLLLADGAAKDRLAAALDGGVAVMEDPYDLLAALSHRPWQAVLLTAPRPEFPALCRAVRQIAPDTRLLALCSVAAEDEVRTLPPGVLDDYFIYPPTPKDLAAIAAYAGRGDKPLSQSEAEPSEGSKVVGRYVSDAPRSVEREQAAGTAGPSPAPAGLSSADLAALLPAATSMESLEAKVANLVAQRLSVGVRWVGAEALRGQGGPLLFVAAAVPRMLVCDGGGEMPIGSREFLEALQACLPALMDNARRVESLHRLAITDHLTGAYNRRYFYHLTDEIIERSGRQNTRVTLLLYDIDNFKHYNETYGHAAGDEILRETAALMKRTSRTHDIVARIGGDEFAVLFWDADRPRQENSKPLESAVALADRFRRAVGHHMFPSLGPEAQGALSISGGLATFPEGGKSCRELLRTADKALREVKKTGKNAIRLIGA